MDTNCSLSQVFSGIYNTVDVHVCSSPYLQRITLKLKNLKTITPHESIYITSYGAMLMCYRLFYYGRLSENIHFYTLMVRRDSRHRTPDHNKRCLTELFKIACENNHLKIVQWLIDNFYDKGLIDHRHDHDYAYRVACFNSNFPIIRWFWEFDFVLRYDYSSYEYIQNTILFWACKNNNLRLIQWIWQMVFSNQVFKDVYHILIDILEKTIVYNHLSIAQWAWSLLRTHNYMVFSAPSCSERNLFSQFMFNIFKTNHITHKNEGFVNACMFGHLKAAQWIWDLDSHSRPNHRTQNDMPLRVACGHGHLHVARWLWDLVPENRPNHRAQSDAAFFQACSKGYLHVAQWLWDLVPENRPDPRIMDDKLFVDVCVNGQYRVMLWLVEIVPGIQDRLNTNSKFWSRCYIGSHENIGSWLRHLKHKK